MSFKTYSKTQKIDVFCYNNRINNLQIIKNPENLKLFVIDSNYTSYRLEEGILNFAYENLYVSWCQPIKSSSESPSWIIHRIKNFNKTLCETIMFTENTIFDFGIHKGKTLDEVAKIDSPYILWCFRNIDKFYISLYNLIIYQKKYPIYSNCIIKNTESPININLNEFVLLKSDLDILKIKNIRYEEYIEMIENQDFDNDNYSIYNNSFYNDDLDIDQQDQEFWDF